MYRPRPLERLSDEKKGSNRCCSTDCSSGGAIAPDAQARLPDRRQPGRHLDRAVPLAGVARGIVQQVDQHAAQVLRRRSPPSGFGRQAAPAGGCRCRPVAPSRCRCRCHGGVQRQRAIEGVCGFLVPHPGEVQHFVHDMGQPVRVLLHHLGELLVPGVGQVFVQQRIGLRDGGQRVADLVRHGGRHAAHAASFSVRMRASISRRSCRNITHRLSERLAWRAVSRVRTRTRRGPCPSCWMANSATCGVICLKAGPRQLGQRAPAGFRNQRERQFAQSALGVAEQMPRGRVGGLTMPCASTTSTPSVRDSITSSLTCICTRAARWLRRARASSRASRAGKLVGQESHDEQAAARSARPGRSAASRPLAVMQRHSTASPSSSRVTAAAVPKASEQRAQHRGDQHRQGEQGGVVDAAALEELQDRKCQHVHADGRDPLRIERPPGGQGL